MDFVWIGADAEMFPGRLRVSGLALGTQTGFATSGMIGPVLSTALAGPDLKNWVGPSMVALGFMVLAGISALTAKETSKYTLKELAELHQSEREKAILTAATSPSTTATRGLAANPGTAK